MAERNSYRDTGDGLYNLLAACYRQAIQDAHRGSHDAVAFLDDTFSDWQQLAARATRRSRRKPMATEEREFHAHRGEPPQRSSGKACTPDEDQVTSFHQVDDETGTWTLDVYNDRHAKQLVGMGCKVLPSTHSAGQLFAVDTRQLIQFLADSEGIAIEFRLRRKRTMTDTQRQELSDRMKRINSERIPMLSDR